MANNRLKNSILIGLSAILLSSSACQRVLPPQVTELNDTSISVNKNSSKTEDNKSTSTSESRSTNLEESKENTSDDETETSTSTNETSTTTLEETQTTSSRKKSFLDHFFNNDDEDAKGESSRNPYNVGELANFDGYDTLFDPFRAEVIIQNVVRGSDALQMVKDANPFNPNPAPNSEYLIAQVLVKAIASKNQESIGLSPYFFSLANGEDLRMYGDVTLIGNVKPVLSPIQIGETSIGYICFQVNKTDTNPYIVFLSRANGGIWFNTNTEASSDSNSNNENDNFHNNSNSASSAEIDNSSTQSDIDYENRGKFGVNESINPTTNNESSNTSEENKDLLSKETVN